MRCTTCCASDAASGSAEPMGRRVLITGLDTFCETNSIGVSSRVLHEINVIGTLNLLAAAGSAGSSVRQVVIKSSAHVYGSSETDPTWFREDSGRTSPVRNR